MKSDLDFLSDVIISVTFVVLCIMVFYYMANIILNHYGIENDNAPIELSVAYLYMTSLPGNMTVKEPLGFEPAFEFRVVNGFWDNYEFSYGYCLNKTLSQSLLRAFMSAIGFDIVIGVLKITGAFEHLPKPVQNFIYYTYPGLASDAIRIGKRFAARSETIVSRLRASWYTYEELGIDAEEVAGRFITRISLIYARLGAKLTLEALGKMTLIGAALVGIFTFTTDYLSVALFKDRQCLYGAHGTTFEKYNNIDDWKFFPNKLFKVQATGGCTNNNTGGNDLIKCRVNPSNKNDVLAEIIVKKIEILNNRKDYNLTLIYNGIITRKFAELP